ncbi:CaiB/BaiF CoA-transferase family protein [Pigmentiphaga soli]|uniref:CaiB/BaiF CoA-transferase family protein n=1 Tax=Pigmentiphaga soli TaxID=1007095 RepID=A0ABP8H4K7_9BURK
MPTAESSVPPIPNRLPLSGLVVLEMAHTVMGPCCGLVLADLGAEVIRVEPAPGGDRTRRLRGFASGFFSYFNRNKRSLCLDLKSERGMALARRLIARADVLVENFAPGTLDRLGLDWETLHALNPRLVFCALKGFLPGPYEHRPALDEIVQYMTGLAYMTGPPGQPLRAGASVVDIMGGVMGAVAILAALRQRDADGVGRRVTSSLYESSAFLVAQHMAGEAVTGVPAPPMPARDSAWAIYETFPTADGTPLFVGITSDRHWEAFCRHFGREDLLADPRYAANEERVRHRDTLRPQVAAAIAARPIEELCGILERIGVPFSPVRRPGELFDDPQLRANDRMLRTVMPDGRTVPFPSLPLEIDGKAPPLRRQPPAAGQHTDEILASLGLEAAEIAELRAAQVVR